MRIFPFTEGPERGRHLDRVRALFKEGAGLMKLVYVACGLGIVACFGYAEVVGCLAVKGEASRALHLSGLAALVAIRLFAGNARYAAIRASPAE